MARRRDRDLFVGQLRATEPARLVTIHQVVIGEELP
jgi:hypothetical protein